MLESIPLEDIFVPEISRHLSLKDLLSLRSCSTECKFIVNECFVNLKCINFSNKNSDTTRKLFLLLLNLNSGRLSSLNLAKCCWVTDSILIATLEKCHKNLKEVILSDCGNLSSVSIQPLIIKCKSLKVLKLSNCHWVTTGSLEALTLHHNLIEDLDLSNCMFISARCFTTMFRRFTALKVLSLEKNQNVNDIVLMQLANSCKQLTTVNLSFCGNITEMGL